MVSENDIQITILTSLFAFGIGYALHHIQNWRSSRNTKRKSIDSLIAGIKIIEKQVKKGETYCLNSKTSSTDINWITIQTSSYDSVINSGVFPSFKIDTQDKISSLFELTKIGNIANLRLLEIITAREEQTAIFINNLTQYKLMLFGIYSKILELTPGLIDALKKERPR